MKIGNTDSIVCIFSASITTGGSSNSPANTVALIAYQRLLSYTLLSESVMTSLW